MKACRKYKKDWVAFLSRELPEKKAEEISRHLQECSLCRLRMAKTAQVLDIAGNFREELERVIETVNWENLAETIVSRAVEKNKKEVQAPAFPAGWKWRWQPLLAGMFLGLILGGLLTLGLINQRKPHLAARQEPSVSVPEDLVERVEVAMARKSTIEYLERSQYLLLELLQDGQNPLAEPEKQAVIRQVLTEKKYLNFLLDDWRLMKAKNICDQIELLFLELNQLSPELSAAELEKLRKMVEENQLLLKINLVKKELQQSEV
ncbi:MAG: hypothetical protein WBI18_06155 [Candidatus Saccharicenans sp.]